MAATDARPVPRKNAAWRVYFAIRKNDGTLITSWTGADSEVSLDGAAFADCTNEATEIGTSGCGYLDLTSSEMNADAVTIKITVTNTSALPLVLTVFPEEAGDYRVADTQKVDVETIKTQALTAAAGITFGVYVGGTAAAAVASTALSTDQWTNTLATNLGTTNTTVATNLNATVSSRLASASYTAPPSAATISTQVASDLATAHGAGSWATATGFSTHSAADVWAVGTRTITGGSLTTSPPTAAVIADAVWDEARSGHVTAGTFGEKVIAELDSTARVKLDASQPDYVPATAASIVTLRGADNDTLKTISDQIDGISSGGTDWTANERTAIRSILGVPASGTTPADPTVGILDTIRDSVATYIAGIATSASLTPGTIVGFPATLTIGDSYTDDCDSAIHVFIRDENDDPITAVGTHDFTDGDFAPECTITQNGNTGRVKCDVEYVTASPENYLKIQIPSKESRRATAGIATVQVLLKWDGAQKALSKQTVTWDGLI